MRAPPSPATRMAVWILGKLAIKLIGSLSTHPPPHPPRQPRAQCQRRAVDRREDERGPRGGVVVGAAPRSAKPGPALRFPCGAEFGVRAVVIVVAKLRTTARANVPIARRVGHRVVRAHGTGVAAAPFPLAIDNVWTCHFHGIPRGRRASEASMRAFCASCSFCISCICTRCSFVCKSSKSAAAYRSIVS